MGKGGDMFLAARRAQMAKDAARYRWLREQHNYNGGSGWHVRAHNEDLHSDIPDDLDAAIDAAMAATDGTPQSSVSNPECATRADG